MKCIALDMSSRYSDYLVGLARIGHSDLLVEVGRTLARKVPGSTDTESFIVSRCLQAVVALEAYCVYLRPSPLSAARAVVTFPGKSEAGTWGSLHKWFLGLHLWCPSFASSRSIPASLCSAIWYNRILHAIFDLARVFAEVYPGSDVSRLLKSSSDFARLTVQLTYGALLVDGAMLSAGVAVMIHPFWKAELFQGEELLRNLRTVLLVRPSVDFVGLAVGRVVTMSRDESVLDVVLEFHALVAVVLQLYEVRDAGVRLANAGKWFSLCMRKLVEELAHYPLGSPLALRSIDADACGRALCLVVQFMCELAGIAGGGRWVLDALRVGLLRAVMDVGAFVALEKRRSEYVISTEFRMDLVKECDELLCALVPHLLTPSIRRLVQKEMARGAPLGPEVLLSWGEWTDVVSTLGEVAVGYKTSIYGDICATTCSYVKSPGKGRGGVGSVSEVSTL
ncbi:hypothetical protein VNI00_011850 [Paramarasmius palmivorus]|uniref:Uncharacterized protein n=1 Tax=Paramarasmius palmivorus TaxID=297713 RepID=A0AAW0C9C7_9AGAR